MSIFVRRKNVSSWQGIMFSTSSLEQYNDEVETQEYIREMRKYEDCVVIFDDKLDYIQKAIDPTFTIEKRQFLDFSHFSTPPPPLPCFDLPEKTIRKKGNKTILFNQIIKGVKNFVRPSACCY